LWTLYAHFCWAHNAWRGWFLYDKQNDQTFLAGVVAISGVIKIWCGLSMKDKTVAHFGFWLAYFWIE
jgi:hypothetical protein